jgi:hypothetical protein
MATLTPEALAAAVERTELEELGPLCEALSKKVLEYRLGHNGFLPRPVFPHAVGIGGVYPCVEVVIRLVDATGKVLGYWLKKRAKQEQGWQDEFQIPGVTALITDSVDDIMGRLAKEVFGVNDPMLLVNRQLVGTEIHDELKERGAICWTTVFHLDVQEHVRLPGDWKLIFASQVKLSKGRLKNVIRHHCQTLRWVHDPNRPDFVDLRQGYTPHHIYEAWVGLEDYRGQYQTERKIEGIRATNPTEAVHLALAKTRLEPLGEGMSAVSYCLPAVSGGRKLEDFADVVG